MTRRTGSEDQAQMPAGTVIHDEPARADSEDSDDPLGLLASFALLASMEDLKTVAAAINGPDGEGWQKAIDKEMSAIESFGSYTLHDPSEVPSHARLISSRMVLHIKLDPTGGESHRLKARFLRERIHATSRNRIH